MRMNISRSAVAAGMLFGGAVRITYPAFPDVWAAPASFVWCVVSPVDLLASSSYAQDFRTCLQLLAFHPEISRPVDWESTRDYPLPSGSALYHSGCEWLLWPLLTPINPSRHLAMPVARGKFMGLPG